MITVRVAPGVTLHGDTPLTATADPPPAAVARLLRQLADDLDRQAERDGCTGDDSCQVPSHWPDPADSGPHRGTTPVTRCTCMWTGDRDLWTRTLPDPTCPAHVCDCPVDHGEPEEDE